MKNTSRIAVLGISLCVLAGLASAQPPRGVAVIGLGEPLLAGEAELALEQLLDKEGVSIVDERSLPEADRTLGDRTGHLSLAAMEALKPACATLVLIRVDYLGDRPLYYMRRSDAAFQSRVIITVIDLDNEDATQTVLNTRVEYTHLNAAERADKTARKALPKLRTSLAS